MRAPSAAAAASLAVLLSVGATAEPARGHAQERALREIVLVRGTVQAASTCTPALELRVLNRSVHLCDATVRRVAVAAADTADQPSPASFDLQGDRPLLAPALAAAAGTRLTVLGEWRPGRKDLFAIEIDVCPCPDMEPERP